MQSSVLLRLLHQTLSLFICIMAVCARESFDLPSAPDAKGKQWNVTRCLDS